MTCNKCGMVIPDGAAFCPECGASFADMAPQSSFQPASQQGFQPASQQGYQPASQQGYQPASQQDFQPASQQGGNYNGSVNNGFGPNSAYSQNPYNNNFQQPSYNNDFQQNSFVETKPAQGGYSTPESAAFAKSALTFGILGLSFACTFYLSFLGIIFSAIALGKAKSFAAIEGSVFGKTKVGRGLAIGGLITGIVLTAILVLVFVACASLMGTRYMF